MIGIVLYIYYLYIVEKLNTSQIKFGILRKMKKVEEKKAPPFNFSTSNIFGVQLFDSVVCLIG